MNIYEKIGGILASARESSGIKQAEAAAILGISRGSIANIESGKQACTLKNLILFSSLYERPPSFFLEEINLEDFVNNKVLNSVKDSHPESLNKVKVAILSSLI